MCTYLCATVICASAHTVSKGVMTMHIGLFLIQLTVGALLFGHGAQKLLGWFGGFGLSGTAGYMESIGLRHGKLMAGVGGANEMVGGALVATGLFMPLGAALVAAAMLVASRTD